MVCYSIVEHSFQKRVGFLATDLVPTFEIIGFKRLIAEDFVDIRCFANTLLNGFPWKDGIVAA
jgi:hypothetical protein